MTILLLVLCVIAFLVTALASSRFVQRRDEARDQRALARRLETAYPVASPTASVHRLVEPVGETAAQPDGLFLSTGSTFHKVPWSAVRSATPAGKGRIIVSVEQVGDVIVPGALGPALWTHLQAAAPVPEKERSRERRV